MPWIQVRPNTVFCSDVQAAGFSTSGPVGSGSRLVCCVVYHRGDTAFHKQLRGNKELDIKSFIHMVSSRYQLPQSDGDDTGLICGPNWLTHTNTDWLQLYLLGVLSLDLWRLASCLLGWHTHTNSLILKLNVQKSKFISSNQVKQTAATTHSTQKGAHASKHKSFVMCADFLKPVLQPATRGRLWCDGFTPKEPTGRSSYLWCV